jgi:hypothetical protein
MEYRLAVSVYTAALFYYVSLLAFSATLQIFSIAYVDGPVVGYINRLNKYISYLVELRSRGRVVSTVTALGAGSSGLQFQAEKRNFSLLQNAKTDFETKCSSIQRITVFLPWG